MTLAVELTGLLGLPLKYLRAQVANSITFQGVVGAIDADEAAAFISVGEADDTQTAPPRAIIRWPEEASIGRISQLSHNWSASIELSFEFPTDENYLNDYENAYASFVADVGEVIREILAVTGQGGFLNVTGIRIGPIGCAVIEENDGVPFFVCHTVVSFEGQP